MGDMTGHNPCHYLLVLEWVERRHAYASIGGGQLLPSSVTHILSPRIWERRGSRNQNKQMNDDNIYPCSRPRPAVRAVWPGSRGKTSFGSKRHVPFEPGLGLCAMMLSSWVSTGCLIQLRASVDPHSYIDRLSLLCRQAA
jgi:hypothetical protein